MNLSLFDNFLRQKGRFLRIDYIGQRKVLHQTRNEDLANSTLESEVIHMKDELKEALGILKLALICLLFCLLTLLMR